MILFLELYLLTRILSGMVKTHLEKKNLSNKINILRLAIVWDTSKIQKWPEMYTLFPRQKSFMT